MNDKNDYINFIDHVTRLYIFCLLFVKTVCYYNIKYRVVLLTGTVYLHAVIKSRCTLPRLVLMNNKSCTHDG